MLDGVIAENLYLNRNERMNDPSRRNRQKAYRKQRYKKGICARCKNKRQRGRVLCVDCTIDRRLNQRKYIGAERWKPGTRGRPIKYYAEDGNYA